MNNQSNTARPGHQSPSRSGPRDGLLESASQVAQPGSPSAEAGGATGAAPLVGQFAIDVGALGRIWLVHSEIGLVALHWSAADARAPVADLTICPPASPIADALRSYFAGAAVEPAELPVDLRGTPFQLRVWRALRRIPRGAVRSYSGVAADLGQPRAMRAVGAANAKNPVAIVVPCHRVVDSGLRLGGYSAGLARKRALLNLEGVRLDGDAVLPGQLDLLGST